MDLFHVSASPHTRDTVTTGRIMADVAIALIPASAFGVYYFGLNAFVVLCVSMLTCVLTEYLYERLMKKAHTPYECSALVTGLLLGMNLPAGVPLWIPVIGGVFAILVVKQLYGGLGHNFMNPALAARCFLLISFTSDMIVSLSGLVFDAQFSASARQFSRVLFLHLVSLKSSLFSLLK